MIDKLIIKNAEKRRKILIKSIPYMNVLPGWIKYTRSVLGITLKELANLAGLSTSTVAQAEKRESDGKVTIATLKKLAKAMECQFVYGFIPNDDISELLQNKAIKKAKEIVLKADIHMSLENQKVNEDLKFRIETLAEKLLTKGKIW